MSKPIRLINKKINALSLQKKAARLSRLFVFAFGSA